MDIMWTQDDWRALCYWYDFLFSCTNRYGTVDGQGEYCTRAGVTGSPLLFFFFISLVISILFYSPHGVFFFVPSLLYPRTETETYCNTMQILLGQSPAERIDGSQLMTNGALCLDCLVGIELLISPILRRCPAGENVSSCHRDGGWGLIML